MHSRKIKTNIRENEEAKAKIEAYALQNMASHVNTAYTHCVLVENMFLPRKSISSIVYQNKS